MSGTQGNISRKWGSGGLPVPHVKLMSTTANYGRHPLPISYHDGSSIIGDFKLFHYPIVTAEDLTDEQIKKWVYVEMAHYVPGKSSSGYNNSKSEAGYRVPSPQVGGANPLGNRWTRGGTHALPFDRPNHYKVKNHNQQIPVFEYLANRMRFDGVWYYDSTGSSNFVKILHFNHNNRRPLPGRSFMYSGKYSPYYFKFRYIMWDDKEKKYISWPWSRVIKLVTRKHPFIVDDIASGTIGRQVGWINPLFVDNEMQCYFETRLP